jgi:hypothetical protein
LNINDILGRKPAVHTQVPGAHTQKTRGHVLSNQAEQPDVEKQLHNLIAGSQEPLAQRSIWEGEALTALVVSLSVVALAVLQFVIRPFCALLNAKEPHDSLDKDASALKGQIGSRNSFLCKKYI